MSENSKLKEKAKKILLGLGVSAVVGSGLVGAKKVHEQNEQQKDNEIANKEWIDKYSKADSIYADAEDNHFYAVKYADKEKLKDLSETNDVVRKKMSEIVKNWEKSVQDNNSDLYSAAKTKDAKQYISVLTTMKEKGMYVDYGKEVDGISLHDLLQANANGDDVRWISINRKKEQIKGEHNLNHVFMHKSNDPRWAGVSVVPVCKKDGDGYILAGEQYVGSGEVKKEVLYGADSKRFTLQDVLEQSPSSFEDAKLQIYALEGVSNILQGEMREAEGYEVDINNQGNRFTKTHVRDNNIVVDGHTNVDSDREPINAGDIKESLLRNYRNKQADRS